ncbi:MAG: cobyrinate a,c-diamide synthase [Alphaproteobacteria bacterium]|jgi:cobyrinic acid a,c-diamide synthase|nr:cobyrinate a,c-diamide synthase [Alphaproteobacteria bacterium]MDP6516006.1 cobyrinate a,c-diamide synthase [Alphaproteobacteria bacterium]
MAPPPFVVIAAPASGSGKTVLTLGLLRHFRNAGVAVSSIKVGPDYIDPGFHQAAGGGPCRNLDPWAMRPETLAAQAKAAGRGAELVIGEGVMGLFDGAASGDGATADLAAAAGWPVVLVVDARGQGASAAAVVKGFDQFRDDVRIAAVIFNRVGSDGHARILREASRPLAIPLLGCIPAHADLALPDRHLGLVQAGEHGDLEGFLEAAAALVGPAVDTAGLRALARPGRLAPPAPMPAPSMPIPPPGQRIAVAQDPAFAFCYRFVLDGWRAAGAEIETFSPLAGGAPPASADAIYLPGGYPELHAGSIAANQAFMDGLRRAAAAGAVVYGECGGYMVLGDGLIDGDGARHAMAGLLGLETSFAQARLNLGYRQVATVADGPLGRSGTGFRGHEFHYATVVREADDAPLFAGRDASGTDLGRAGLRRGSVLGSFTHLIDAA